MAPVGTAISGGVTGGVSQPARAASVDSPAACGAPALPTTAPAMVDAPLWGAWLVVHSDVVRMIPIPTMSRNVVSKIPLVLLVDGAICFPRLEMRRSSSKATAGPTEAPLGVAGGPAISA